MVLVKAEIPAFINTVLADFISRSGANTVEAGYPRHSAEHKYGYTCPAMQRLVFEGRRTFVRLSANICQLHRPNTIPIFCAAVSRITGFDL